MKVMKGGSASSVLKLLAGRRGRERLHLGHLCSWWRGRRRVGRPKLYFRHHGIGEGHDGVRRRLRECASSGAPCARQRQIPTPLTLWQMDVEARVKSLADVEVTDIGQRYKMQEELGSGAQATVYKGQNKKSGGKVAIKVLELQELEDDELFDALRMEIGLLRQVSAPACPSRPHSWGPAGVPCARAVGVGPGHTPH